MKCYTQDDDEQPARGSRRGRDEEQIRTKQTPHMKTGKRKVQEMLQSQTANLPRHQEEEETKPNKRKSSKRTKSIKTSSLFPKRGIRNAKWTGKPKNKITQGKT